MDAIDPGHLRLTDFMDLPTLQAIQDGFAAVAEVKATITDATGAVLTEPTSSVPYQHLHLAPPDGSTTGAELVGPQREGDEYVAPIVVNDQRLGTIRMTVNATSAPALDESVVAALAERFKLPLEQVQSLLCEASHLRGNRPAAIQFLYLMANAITRLCFQEFQLRQRIEELTAVYNVTMMLADARDLKKVLDRAVQVICEVMGTKASSLRLVDEANDELVIGAVYNLSPQYLSKGRIRLSTAEIDKVALSPDGFEYVADMAADPRVKFHDESVREGIVSMLSVGMRYKGKPVGVLRVYTDHERRFSPLKIDLLKAVAAQAAAAIENARLAEESRQAEELERQVQLAADVQHRMIPQNPPTLPGFDLTSVYEPCYSLGGDFFDFIPLPGENLGLAVADVSGKGVPASLIMASVRAFLRAQVDNVYYLYEVMQRINAMLYRDTKPTEFVSLFYGVLDARSRRFTYCNAGHPSAMVLREGKVLELVAQNLVLGVAPQEVYSQAFIDLLPGDLLLLYTDGVTEAMNFKSQIFGRQRLIDAFARGGVTADDVAQNILWELRKYVGMAPQSDDTTMIVVKVK